MDGLQICISDVFEPSRSLAISVPESTTVGHLKQMISQHHSCKPEVSVQRLVLYGKVLDDENASINALVKATHLDCSSKPPVIHLVYKAITSSSLTSNRAGLSASPDHDQRASTAQTATSSGADQAGAGPHPSPAAVLPAELVHPVLAAAYHAALAALTNTDGPASAAAGTPPWLTAQLPLVMMPQMMMPAYFVHHQARSSPNLPPFANAAMAQRAFHLGQPYHPGTFMMCQAAPVAYTNGGADGVPLAHANAHGGLEEQEGGDAGPRGPEGVALPAEPVRRVWTWTIRISLRSLVQLVVMFVMLYNQLSLQRFGMIIIGAALLMLAQLGSLHQLLRDAVLRLAAPLMRPMPAEAGAARAAAADSDADTSDREDGEAAPPPPPPPQPSLLREVGIALLGFVASLLPSFNADAADAAAVAAAQQELMRERGNQGVDQNDDAGVMM